MFQTIINFFKKLFGFGRNTTDYRPRSNVINGFEDDDLNESLLVDYEMPFYDVVSDIESEDTFYLSSDDGPVI